MLRLLPALAFAVLAACGADAPPEPPASKSTTGISISGCAQFGVVHGVVGETRDRC